ncbi:MAG: lipopolysaccharide biosynthesis protein, partial [Chromatiales bacterium]
PPPPLGGGRDQQQMLKAQLATQKSELASLTDRYSDKHPEVEKLQRAISDTETAIKQARRQGKSSLRKEISLSEPDNPNYIQLRIQLDAAEAEARSLRQTRKDLQDKLSGYEQRLMSAPEVERKYKILIRDYENAMAMYKEITDKQMEAELAEALETERKGERFSLIEPPQLPEKPIKPNRFAMLLLSFVLSFAGGIGNIAIRESMDQTVHGAKGVFSITQAPPLAVIPYIENNQDQRRRVTRRTLLLVTVALIIITSAVASHFFIKPLDAVWLDVLLKMGIEIK